MTVLQAWKDSLELLKPQNLKLLALVTLNSWVQGWKALFQSKIIYYVMTSWIVICSFIFILFRYVSNNWWKMSDYVIGFLLFLSGCCIFYGVALSIVVWFKAIRSSVERKTFAYFMNGLVKQICGVAFVGLLCGTLFVIGSNVFFDVMCIFNCWQFLFLLYSIQIIFFIWLFFFLDAQSSLRTFLLSVNCALKMFFYNLPLFCACMLLYAMYAYGTFYMYINYIWRPDENIFRFGMSLLIQYFIIYPLSTCLLNNIYIKKLHEQFDLYFSLPEQKEYR